MADQIPPTEYRLLPKVILSAEKIDPIKRPAAILGGALNHLLIERNCSCHPPYGETNGSTLDINLHPSNEANEPSVGFLNLIYGSFTPSTSRSIQFRSPSVFLAAKLSAFLRFEADCGAEGEVVELTMTQPRLDSSHSQRVHIERQYTSGSFIKLSF